MNESDRILEKIRKCLALSKSANEHEAAAALRQAQKLMQEHGVDSADVAASMASESRSRAGAVKTPARWESWLAGRIGRTFGCKVIFITGTGQWMFVGVGAAPEVTSYSMTVMLRQVRKARQAYIRQKLRRCGPNTKTRRADTFCEAWVYSALRTVIPVTLEEDGKCAISAYIEKRYSTDGTVRPRNRNAGRNYSNSDMTDVEAGQRGGEGAYLHQGVSAADGPALLG